MRRCTRRPADPNSTQRAFQAAQEGVSASVALVLVWESVAWVLRPTPGLRETIAARRAQLNLSDESTLAVHVRHGDRVKSRGARDVSARKFAHVAARLLGAQP